MKPKYAAKAHQIATEPRMMMMMMIIIIRDYFAIKVRHRNG
jgi:hypothetical protein